MHAVAVRRDRVPLYARVCTNADHKAGGKRQLIWVLPVGFSGKLLGIVKAVKEVGSGMKGHRRGRVGQVSVGQVSDLQRFASSGSSSSTG
ncbi:hypothetical protein MPNT_10271 [Candidatus Methylacidithermus pantelleriae]|uniref:Uncharacterized protein n=1 Tax=Candidatus Methylacidithermus pantelleriae TaxID=2744239 RepID=A0A8J2FRB9_9BACT|nr:hypothetical protein MPNT_10271 [Candidatus Methylacidithermus pantelleriae]